MKLEEIKDLPDYLSPDQIRLLFLEILSNETTKNLIEKENLAEALWELSIRQWHTYQKIDLDIKDKIENWLINNLSHIYSRHLIELIGGITGMLGLIKAFEHFQKVYSETSLSNHIKQEFENIFKEYGNSIEDPYSDLK